MEFQESFAQICTYLWNFAGVEEDITNSVSRPEFSGQCVHGHHSPGHAEAVLLQRQLLPIQTHVDSEEKRAA